MEAVFSRSGCCGASGTGQGGSGSAGGGGSKNRMVDAGPPPAGSRSCERVLIEETVAQVFGVEGRELRLATRGRAKVARARQVAMYLAHVSFGLSLTDVGRVFSRDRTTVSHACGLVEDGRDDPVFDRVVELLEQVVQALRARSQGIAATGSRFVHQ